MGPFKHINISGLVGPFKHIDIAGSVGPFRIINPIIRRPLWAHMRMLTLLLGGPIQDYRYHYSVTAEGPFVNVDIATWWAHSGLSTSSFSRGCRSTRECRHCRPVGPFRIIDINIWRRLWAHTRMSTLLLSGPTQNY
jgi:hypothetical protein